ncbi:MAG: cytochrome c biogenesis protein CcdA [Chloroflexi bacterium]|nr:cytochrome c biogenesis protein CcdA [Chloroflexota bacterium]
MDASSTTLSLAFLAGLASFLSPCVFALVPAYISYLGGRSMALGEETKSGTWITFTHGLAFVLGFSVVFILIGVFIASLGAVFGTLSDWLMRIGGIVVILFGLHMTGLIRIRFLEYDLRPQANLQRNRGYLSSAMMGVFFSAGWSPCVGPILGAILTLALNGGSPVQGALMLSAYSAGLAIPFLLAATQIGWVTYILRRFGRVTVYIERAMGAVLIVIGAFLLSGRFSTLGTLGFFFENFDEVAVGRSLLIGLLLSLLVGLIPGILARRQGKPFFDWWFLGVGASVAILGALYFLDLLPASLLAI